MDLWLTDQLTARYQIMRLQRRRVNIPMWLYHILDQAGEVDIDAVNAAEVRDYVHRVVALTNRALGYERLGLYHDLSAAGD